MQLRKKNPLKLGGSSEAKKEIQARWTLQKTNSVYTTADVAIISV